MGALFIRKDGNEGYTIYRLDPENKSKRIIFSSVNYVMPDSFICGDKIINNIMKPLKKGIMKEKILLINPGSFWDSSRPAEPMRTRPSPS